MNVSQFDGNVAFSGGGFMPPPANDAAEPSTFTPSKDRESHVLLPLTVKQICAAANPNDDRGNLVVDGIEAHNVRLVGFISNKAERITDMHFTLDDGTGRVDCTKWIDDVATTREMEKYLDGMYIRVQGQLRSLLGKRQLTVFSIRQVTDFNEIPAHFIECIYVHLYNTDKHHGGAHAQPQMTNASYQPRSSQFPSRFDVPALGGSDQLVVEYLQRPAFINIEQGVHVDELARQLNLPLDKLMDSIRSLEAEGLIYSTVDEFHFRSTGNG
uniref:Replication protein A C-terminal domain-containing protein n=1 Tax=Kalanchoe fedtschenkoi TaxID=63787 RepID=A0A7N0RCH6_KALFE